MAHYIIGGIALICVFFIQLTGERKNPKTKGAFFYSQCWDKNGWYGMLGIIRIVCIKETPFEMHGPGARFSKVPKLYGPFSGVTIPFVSQERRGFKLSNFTDMFLLVSLKTC